MELHQIRYFLAVCEALNFTRAAERCHVSQPSLTQAVKKLEGELGGALFLRERGRVSLTALGEALRPSFEQILGETHSVVDTAQHLLKLQKAPLTVGVLETIGPDLPTGFLARFKTQHPGVEVELLPAPHAELVAAVEHGRMEVVLTSLVQPLPDTCHAHVLYEEPYVVVFPAGHRFRRYEAVPLERVSREPYVDRLACELRDAVLETCRAQNVELYATHRSASETWVQAMVRAGMGFAFMPAYSVTLAGLHARPLVDPAVARSVALVTLAEHPLSAAAAAFAGSARQHPWTS